MMRRIGENAQNWHLSFNFTNVSDYATIKYRTFVRAQELIYLWNTRKAFVKHK
jgi:hypothetical protein